MPYSMNESARQLPAMQGIGEGTDMDSAHQPLIIVALSAAATFTQVPRDSLGVPVNDHVIGDTGSRKYGEVGY